MEGLHFNTCNFYTNDRSRQSAFVEGELEQLLLVEVNSSRHQKMEIDNKKQPRIKISYLLNAEHYVSCELSQSSAATELYSGFDFKNSKIFGYSLGCFLILLVYVRGEKKNSLLQTAVPIDERRCFSLCRQVFIISVLLFKELEFPDMMMLVFSNRHR